MTIFDSLNNKIIYTFPLDATFEQAYSKLYQLILDDQDSGTYITQNYIIK